ncbi:NADH-ubiquinone dehydrogenase subunit [Mesorhizobium sp. L-8-10]|uniref:NADH-ubiquinone dehydrogenase n=1 Tax=Mesorhizobium sp. L-8-10 TaxID=2744523 RepID=UPI001927C7F9|nr:NADH-ubiquinone dehydrogenase [Mesorhizobium sp. L-8-10]BCH33607.1 NADH-ubiquinone dehydrogenase subunit [Mesorhizobium sp. L-8-10]
MSMFSILEHLMPDVKQFEEMNREINALLPKELASAVNLMVHPAGGFAAASALGIGFAGHAFGMWMGAVAGMAEASQRLLASGSDDFGSEPSRRTPSTRARAAAETLIAHAQEAVSVDVPEEAKPVTDEAGVKKAVTPVAAETVAALLPEDFRRPAAIDRPDAPDDLKKISGIGPKLESVLNGLGVWTYAQIADWSAPEIAWVDDYLAFKGRIGRDDWIGQAAKLAAGETKH